MKMPKEVFVAWTEDAGKNDTPWIEAGETAAQMASSSEWRTVGVYKLVKTIKVRESHEVQTK